MIIIVPRYDSVLISKQVSLLNKVEQLLKGNGI